MTGVREAQAAVAALLPSVVALSFAPLDTLTDPHREKAAAWIDGSGFVATVTDGLAPILKFPSGRAWLSKYQQMQCRAQSEPGQRQDVTVAITCTEPVMDVAFTLDTNANLGRSNNADGFKEALEKAIPQLLIGRAMDTITASGALQDAQAAVVACVPSLAVGGLEVDLVSIASMEQKACDAAARFLIGSGFIATLRDGLQPIVAVGSGRAWLAKYSQMKLKFASQPGQRQDVTAAITCTEPLIDVTITLDTNANLGSSSNADGFKEALEKAIPQLRTGKDMDNIMASGKLQEVQAAVIAIVPSLAIGGVDVDLWSICNMDRGACDAATRWVVGSGFSDTVRDGLQKIVDCRSGAAWLARYQLMKIRFLSQPGQRQDVTAELKFVQQESPAAPFIIDVAFTLDTNANLSSSSNADNFKEQAEQALPQLVTGRQIDRIMSSGHIDQVQQALMRNIGVPAMILLDNFLSFSHKEGDALANFIVGSGFQQTIDDGIDALRASGQLGEVKNKCTALNVMFTSVPGQRQDVNVSAKLTGTGDCSVVISLDTNANLQSSSNGDEFAAQLGAL